MKPQTAHHTDGLEWLRAIRRDLQRDLGQNPQQRAAYYQAKEKKLAKRVLPPMRCARQAAA